jgi:hypothetical protein
MLFFNVGLTNYVLEYIKKLIMQQRGDRALSKFSEAYYQHVNIVPN